MTYIQNVLDHLAAITPSSVLADELTGVLIIMGEELADNGIRSIDDAQDALAFITETTDLGDIQQRLIEQMALFLAR